MGKCACRKVYEVERIMEGKGPITKRVYKIRWAGYSEKHDSWEPRNNVQPSLIKEFEKQNNVHTCPTIYFSWPHRCAVCDLPFKTARGAKIHESKMHKATPSCTVIQTATPKLFTGRTARGDKQNFKGTKADKAVKRLKIKSQQSSRPTVFCGSEPLENVAQFKYLGSLFNADAKQDADIEARIAQAFNRCGKLRHIFGSPDLSITTKMRLYVAACCSLLIFGCETWTLTTPTIRRINGANSRMLARITGRPITIRDEARPLTTSWDVVKQIRRQRLKWLGHILRKGPSTLVFQALTTQSQMGRGGSLLMDAPKHYSLQHLQEQAQDRAAWQELVRSIV